MKTEFLCEVVAPMDQWIAGALNWSHFIAYGVLMLAGSLTFRERPIAKAGALVLAGSGAVEFEQAVFTVGHCRIRDLLPNLLGVALAGAGSWAVTRGGASASSSRGK